MKRYQIRRNGFGLCLVEAESPIKALVKFVEEQGGDVLDVLPTAEKNAITWNGILYYTEPAQ